MLGLVLVAEFSGATRLTSSIKIQTCIKYPNSEGGLSDQRLQSTLGKEKNKNRHRDLTWSQFKIQGFSSFEVKVFWYIWMHQWMCIHSNVPCKCLEASPILPFQRALGIWALCTLYNDHDKLMPNSGVKTSSIRFLLFVVVIIGRYYKRSKTLNTKKIKNLAALHDISWYFDISVYVKLSMDCRVQISRKE